MKNVGARLIVPLRFISYAEQPFQAKSATTIQASPLMRKNKKPAIPARLSHFFRLTAFSSSDCFSGLGASTCSSSIVIKTPIRSNGTGAYHLFNRH